MQKDHTIVSAAAFLILILFVFSSVVLLTSRVKQEVPETSAGYADLSDFDFDQKLAYIPHTSLLYYRNELYTPEDSELGNIKAEPLSWTISKAGFISEIMVHIVLLSNCLTPERLMV